MDSKGSLESARSPSPSQKVQVPSTLPSRKCIADNSSHCNSHAMKVWALAISGIWNDPSILVKLFFIQFLWRPIQIDQQSISWQYLVFQITWINLFKLTTSLFQIPQHPSVLPLVQLDQTRTQTQSWEQKVQGKSFKHHGLPTYFHQYCHHHSHRHHHYYHSFLSPSSPSS